MFKMKIIYSNIIIKMNTFPKRLRVSGFPCNQMGWNNIYIFDGEYYNNKPVYRMKSYMLWHCIAIYGMRIIYSEKKKTWVMQRILEEVIELHECLIAEHNNVFTNDSERYSFIKDQDDECVPWGDWGVCRVSEY
jgi:hypothetical protein